MVKNVLDYRFYLEELTKVGAYFQKFTVLRFLGR